MARQFKKPETGRPAASGFLCSGAPCPIDPKTVNRGEYCHRYAICTAKKKIDPDQTVCLICNDFLPPFPRVDPLAQARVMGFTIGNKTIKAALAFEAIWELPAAAPSPPPEPTPVPKPKSKLNGLKTRSMRPKPAHDQQRYSNSACKDPVLPATLEYFFRNKLNLDGLSYYCKPCQCEKQQIPDPRNPGLKNRGKITH